LQASIESWFRYLKERVIWRNEFETIDQAHAAIGAYVDHYHDRPHLDIDYRTPKEVRQTWEDAREEFDGLQKQGGLTCTRGGSGPLDPRIHR
jgi:transposase InsO family protein